MVLFRVPLLAVDYGASVSGGNVWSLCTSNCCYISALRTYLVGCSMSSINCCFLHNSSWSVIHRVERNVHY